MPFTLDPEVAAVLASLAAGAPSSTPLPVGDVATRRAVLDAMFAAVGAMQPTPADVITRDVHAASHDGAEILLRWYAKKGAAPGSAVVFLHAGGMISGSVDLFDGTVARYVSASGVPMLAVDYRRAPEHRHPTPIEDAFAGLRWLHEHAAELGVRSERIAVMGDSAGGGLAAALAILARDRGAPAIARQILVMPMLDDRTTTPDPHIAPFALWSYDDNATGWQALLGDAAGARHVPAVAAPARLDDASALPPAYIEVGQLDIFRDDAIAYATKLGRAGVPVELHLHPGVPHEFDFFAFETSVARRAMADRIRVLQSI
jgi:acetyl esterase/lipase